MKCCCCFSGMALSFHWFCGVIPLVLQRHSIDFAAVFQWNGDLKAMQQCVVVKKFAPFTFFFAKTLVF